MSDALLLHKRLGMIMSANGEGNKSESSCQGIRNIAVNNGRSGCNCFYEIKHGRSAAATDTSLLFQVIKLVPLL